MDRDGGFPKCPCLSTRGEGGQKTQKTVHMVCRWPLVDNETVGLYLSKDSSKMIFFYIRLQISSIQGYTILKIAVRSSYKTVDDNLHGSSFSRSIEKTTGS